MPDLGWLVGHSVLPGQKLQTIIMRGEGSRYWEYPGVLAMHRVHVTPKTIIIIT